VWIIVVLMSQDGADVVACAQQLGREGMPKRVRRRRLDDPREAHRLAHVLLDDGFVEVMPVADAGPAVGVVGGRREDVWPPPLPVGAGVLAGQGAWQRGTPQALAEVVFVLSSYLREMVAERLLAGSEQQTSRGPSVLCRCGP